MVAGMLLLFTAPTTPDWQADWAAARRVALRENKPIFAVLH